MTNDKSAEIVWGLREMLPPQVDYAKLVCAEDLRMGSTTSGNTQSRISAKPPT